MQLWGSVVAMKLFVSNFIFTTGTVMRFLNPQLHLAKRYAQCRGTDTVLRTLAHLLAALSCATPKQAKEPTIIATGETFKTLYILGI